MASPFYRNQPSSQSCIPLKRKPSPRVISIPVHFVDSKSNRVHSSSNKSDSALRIQKVFRGFLLRKSVDEIVKINNQVEEIERRIANKDSVELIRKDPKERLRINETLMALLFKLDSVRGIDSGVRDLRKRVIRKAIGLQERVDALPPESENQGMPPIEDPDEMPPIENVIESMDHSCECVVKEMVEECNTINSKAETQKQDGDMDDCSKGVQETGPVLMAGEKKSNEELQTQMIRMMSELVEKNELQTRMINSLTHRVGQLEKAFLCDKLPRTNKKKKQRHHDAPADGNHQ